MSDNAVNLLDLRKPFSPEQIGKLPRGPVQLDYVGHADVTGRLLEVDPEWKWEPGERDIDKDALAAAVASGNPEIVQMVIENSPPKFDLDRNGNPVGLWIKLTVGGVTRRGYGSVPSSQSDAVKVLIGDALRNAAMRFGVALELWAKGDRADPTRENATASAGQASRRGSPAADAWDNATPAAKRNGSQQRGQVSRPEQAKPTVVVETDPEEPDIDAQGYADEAHGSMSLTEMEDIHRRAREAGKLAAMVRNPAGGADGKLGKLAVYLDWKRKQVKETDDALNALNAVVDETGFPVNELETHVKSVTGADLESANAAQLRHAGQVLRTMQGAAA